MIINFPKNSDGSFSTTGFNIEKLVANHADVINGDKIHGFNTVGTGMVTLLYPSLKITPTGPLGFIEWNGSATVHTTEYSLWCKLFIRFKISIIDNKKDDCVQLEITIDHRYIDKSMVTQPAVTPGGHKLPQNTPLSPEDGLFSVLKQYVDNLKIDGFFDTLTAPKITKQDTNEFSDTPEEPELVLDRLIQIHKVLAVSKFGSELLERFNTDAGLTKDGIYAGNYESIITATGEVISDANTLKQLEENASLLKEKLNDIINDRYDDY